MDNAEALKALDNALDLASQVDGWESFPSEPLEKALDAMEVIRARLTDPGYVRVPVDAAPHCDYGYITPAKGNPWFAYDPEGDGMLFFETEEEARAVAQKSVDLSLDEFWSEDVDRVCYGRVTHAATQVNRSDRPENLDEDGWDEDGEYWPADCEFKCNYELLPIAATQGETQ